MNSIFGFDSENVKRAICNAIQNALEVEMNELMEEYELEYRNGYGQFRWNLIIKKLKQNCDKFGVFQRGAWCAPAVFCPDYGYLLTFMTEERLQVVQREKGGTHYLLAAVSWNEGIQPEQMTLFCMDDDDDMWREKSRTQLAESVNVDESEIKGHVLVLFSYKFGKVISIRSIRLTPDLKNSEFEEDWSEYLMQPFAETNTVLQLENTFIDDEQLVELK